jgi:hypothetical protein
MVARLPNFLFSRFMQDMDPMIDTDSAPRDGARGSVWIPMLAVVALLSVGAPKPAQAGVISDTVDQITAYIADIDRVVTEWFFGVVEKLERPDRMELAAAAVRRMAVEGPGPLAALAQDAGFSLTGYKIAQADQGSLLLTFGFEREVETDRRMAMWREILKAAESGDQPELELTRALLDASDWRQIDIGPDYELVGVEIEVGETLTTHMVYRLITGGG